MASMTDDNEESAPSPEVLRLHVGQPAEIFLGPCDARNGYVWIVRELPECVALECTNDLMPAEPSHGRLDGRIVRIVGAQQGEGLLRCALTHPWAPGDAADERVYQVQVSTPERGNLEVRSQ